MWERYRNVPVPLSVVVLPIPDDFIPHVQRILEAHDGRLEVENLRHTVHFPPRTVKHFIWPAVLSWRWTVVFPDGYEITEVELRNGSITLGFDPEEFPEELRANRRLYLYP